MTHGYIPLCPDILIFMERHVFVGFQAITTFPATKHIPQDSAEYDKENCQRQRLGIFKLGKP
jgi:hypothetical protein